MSRIIYSLLTIFALGVSFAGAADDEKKSAGPRTVVARAASMETEELTNKAFDVKKKEERSMLDGMTILGATGQWTIVPANAFLAKPTSCARYVLDKPTGSYTKWAEFSRRNRGWLNSHEVTLETIKGEDPITEKQIEVFEKSGKVIVATYKNSPVSVLPPKPKSKE